MGYAEYLNALSKPYRKLVKLEFLQPDETVAFALGGRDQKVSVGGRDTRAFLQGGSLTVTLQNGQRRRASVTLSNLDGSFDYAVNKLWFGQRLRLSMGMTLPDGSDIWFPMGVFYAENPTALYAPSEKTSTLSLVDKWAYLDGTLFGNLEASYVISRGTVIWTAIEAILRLGRTSYIAESDPCKQIDPAPAYYTEYYIDKLYDVVGSDGSITEHNWNSLLTPYTITEERGSSLGALILRLADVVAASVGYDCAGMFRADPSQDNISDADKPVLYDFSLNEAQLLSISENSQNTAVYNDVTVAGEGLTTGSVSHTIWARAVNDDPSSPTNINLIGRKVYTEDNPDYFHVDQCASLARWILKRKTVLQKSVTIECSQMFHLRENDLVAVRRTDKPGSPVEKHLIQGFSIPIDETGAMTINCVSVNDIPDFTITTSVGE